MVDFAPVLAQDFRYVTGSEELWTADASDLGFPPGFFPPRLVMTCADGRECWYTKDQTVSDAVYYVEVPLSGCPVANLCIIND